MTGAVVFAGGGLAGIAWETGVLYGIQSREPAGYAAIVDASTTFIGTSAGSAVAAQVAGGTPLTQLYEAQLASETAEIGSTVDLAQFAATMSSAFEGASSPEEVRRRIGAIALAADTVAPEARMAAIDARLPNKAWPERRLLLTAIDAVSGDLRIFDRDSGVGLVEAVAASCAVPGVWPTVAIEGHNYMDGGMRSVGNVDLAAGSDPVLILVPSPPQTALGDAIPQAELEPLGSARVHVVYADDASVAAFGANPLDPAVRKPAALAGFEYGTRIAGEVAAFWAGA